MQTLDIKSISVNDGEYPAEFSELMKPVRRFYAAGNLDLLGRVAHRRVGIIGTRKMTAYGREVARDMARAAARAGVTVVSGLAFGIDSVAHQAALDVSGLTIAVLPGSLHKIYPARHYGLSQEIISKNGLLLSEYEKPTPPMRHYFIERNRLIAALSDVVLIVEAHHKSGTNHTVDAAVAMGRTVAAVPGNINSSASEGTNQLIRDGLAPVTSISDLMLMLGVNEKLIKPQHQAENNYEAKILEALMEQNLSTDQLLNKTGMKVIDLNIHLTKLELKRCIERSQFKWRLIK